MAISRGPEEELGSARSQIYRSQAKLARSYIRRRVLSSICGREEGKPTNGWNNLSGQIGVEVIKDGEGDGTQHSKEIPLLPSFHPLPARSPHPVEPRQSVFTKSPCRESNPAIRVVRDH